MAAQAVERDDWVKCVKHPDMDPDIPEPKAWCGRGLFQLWAFVDWDHAALNALRGGRMTCCPDCRTALEATFREQDGEEGVAIPLPDSALAAQEARHGLRCRLCGQTARHFQDGVCVACHAVGRER